MKRFLRILSLWLMGRCTRCGGNLYRFEEYGMTACLRCDAGVE